MMVNEQDMANIWEILGHSEGETSGFCSCAVPVDEKYVFVAIVGGGQAQIYGVHTPDQAYL